jgi:cytochrome c2
MLLLGLVLIGFWGFTGSWEYPTLEPPLVPMVHTFVPAADEPSIAPGAMEPGPLAVAGELLFAENGCEACHSTGTERKIGPGLGGIFGETAELHDGTLVEVDEAYLVESILQPQAKVVAGFEDAAMPSYEGLLTGDDVRALACYIKSLR